MNDFQKAGYCTRCNMTPCYEVITIWADGERYPGEPKRLGKPLDGVRVGMLLYDGTYITAQVCDACAKTLTPDDYVTMWQRILRSWKREMAFNPNENKTKWWESQFNNGILAEMGRKGLVNGSQS